MTCSNSHKNIWRSQPSSNRQSRGNILICSVTLVSATPFKEFMAFSDLLGYSVLEKPGFTNFRGDTWLVVSKKNIVEKTIQY